jgi:hypothetical protein
VVGATEYGGSYPRPGEEFVGPCGWCGEKAYTSLYVEGKPSHKKHKLTPVCDQHEKKFIARGMISVRSHRENEYQ